MDFNDMLLSSLVLYGRYDTSKVHRNELRVFMNHFLAFLQLACSLKMVIIMFAPWDDERPILFYLIEFYVINSGVQKAFYVAISGVHFHIFILYLYWGHLCSDPVRMHYLNFLFTPDIRQLCRQYDLTLRSTRKFVRRVKIYRRIMWVVIAGAMTIFYALTIRCLIESYARLPIGHFLFIACPSAALTLFGYIFLPYSFLSTYLLALVTMDFLVLRADNLSEQIMQKFHRPVRFQLERDTILLMKHRKQMMKILQTAADIVKQFKATNNIFDHLISLTFASCLLGALIYPVFIFLNIPENLKIMMVILYFIALGNNCFIISIFNDSFISKMKVLDSSIHHSMPMFMAVDVKNTLSNYLILNGQEKRLSFTFLHSFDYSTNNLIEYMVHSISLILMIIQAVRSGTTANNTSGILSSFAL